MDNLRAGEDFALRAVHSRPSGSTKALKTEYAHTMTADGFPTTVIEVKG
jgi:hypothetical protein